MLILGLAVFGLVVGSFLNVCIYRIPKEESIIFPGSHCQHCQKALSWYDNVPVLSYIFLRGRCRHCDVRISTQYIFVEILTAILVVIFYLTFGFSVKGVAYLALSMVFLAVTFIDFRYQIIPDLFTLPGIALGVLISCLFPLLHGKYVWWDGLMSSGIGLLVGGGSLYLAGVIAEFILKKEAMGGGDVKFLAMIGAFLGWPAVLWTIFSSSVIASMAGVYLKFKKGQELIPYGPFLAAGAFMYMFFGSRIIQWYLGFVGYRP